MTDLVRWQNPRRPFRAALRWMLDAALMLAATAVFFSVAHVVRFLIGGPQL